MKISVELDREQAKALLMLLRRIGPDEVRLRCADVDVRAFEMGSERLRIALRGVVEPSWRDKP
jgi:hypothetical protein